MAKQAKAKPATQKGRNNDRPNGKAWKSKWGTNPPVGQSTVDHDKSLKSRGR